MSGKHIAGKYSRTMTGFREKKTNELLVRHTRKAPKVLTWQIPPCEGEPKHYEYHPGCRLFNESYMTDQKCLYKPFSVSKTAK